jgi:hypothetical protein
MPQLTPEDSAALADLDTRMRTILPGEYQDSYEQVQPVSMGSAGLKYTADGQVAWDEIWQSFCDLAMAGGPPHKGTLLESGQLSNIEAHPHRYDRVAEEICRGIRMAADLTARPSLVPGWVRIRCHSEAMSAWLLRAIVMENVAARAEGATLDVPAAPHFRIDKEIKNVVTVVAKTCHYWVGHIPPEQQRAIATMFVDLGEDAPLIEPGVDPHSSSQAQATAMAETIARETALVPANRHDAGWLGLECPNVQAAVWMMRALVVNNVLSRREATVLFVPVNPVSDPGGEAVVNTLVRVHQLALVSAPLHR